MPTLHPRSGEQGQPVTIKHPSTPTPQSHWLDPHATAITVPDGELPATLNGVALAPWHDHPASADEWNALTNTTLAGQEPPLKKAPGMKLSAGVVVREPDGRFWVVAPTNRFGGYDWVFPKGTVGQGMSLQATALCEALEESGLRVRITGLLGDFARTTSVCRYYLAERIGGSPAAMGWESQAVALAPLETLPGLLTAAADQPVLAAIRQVHKRLREELLANGVLTEADGGLEFTMTKATAPTLTIQEIELPYGGDGFKGRLFAAVPESDKPLTVTADQWRQQILETAESSGFKHLVVPWSFWPEGCPPKAVRLEARHVQVMDTVAGIELLCDETPERGLTEVSELLRSGHDLLLVCASQGVPGFIPAALTQMSEPGIHIAKLWYPVVVSKGYELTPFQIGYLTGFDNPKQPGLTQERTDRPPLRTPTAHVPASRAFERCSNALGLEAEFAAGEKAVRPEDFWRPLQQMPERHATLYLKRHFSAQEMSRIRHGFQPKSDDDKWFLYCSGSHLYMHRSWTGDLIYEVRFKYDLDGGAYTSQVIVNRDPQQWQSSDTEDLLLLEHVIAYHLLGSMDRHASAQETQKPNAATSHIPEEQIILQLGTEGGSITLSGLQTPEGWTFKLDGDESTVLALIEEDALHPYPRLPLATWRAALKRLDQYRWTQLYPLEIHTEFIGKVTAALKARQGKGIVVDWRNWEGMIGTCKIQ